MWEEILSKAQREAELRREDSLDDTVSTVETFVTNTVSELGRVEELETVESDVEKQNRDSVTIPDPEGVPGIKLFWWRHSRRIIKMIFIILILLGLGLLLPGLLVPVYGLKIAGICVLVTAGCLVFMRGVMFFTSKEEREKAVRASYIDQSESCINPVDQSQVPYSGFNTFTPGVSWGKVFAQQRESAGVGGGGGISLG